MNPVLVRSVIQSCGYFTFGHLDHSDKTRTIHWSSSAAAARVMTIILILTVLAVVVELAAHGAPGCGYESCDIGKANMLNVHLVPHSHSDTGWDKTVDEYFYGSKNDIQDVGLQYVLESMVQALYFDKRRRFTWIEVAYFWRWWEEKDETMKNVVRQLVAEGRLMFGNNGWSMSDEGSPYYQEILDQHTLGQEFLAREFGEQCARPLTAWQIDTFGHSKEMANLMAQMGHDSFYMARLDYQEKEARWANRSLQMMWMAGAEGDEATSIFTSVLPRHYSPLEGFNFEYDEPIMDDPRLYGNNLDDRIESFVRQVREWSSGFAVNHLLVPMGEDFKYERSNRWFLNMDKIIHHINSRSTELQLNVMYSTVPCYTYAVHATGHSFPVKSDDFFPYADIPHRFWTGTFTSRPTMKGFVRDSNALLQTCKQLSVLFLARSGHIDEKQQRRVDFLRRAMAIVTNHGQFPGTQTQLVTFDNALRLHNGTLECEKLLQDAFESWGPSGSALVRLCSTLNISACAATEESFDEQNSQVMEVIFYNSLAHDVVHWARIPLTTDKVRVSFINGTTILSQSVAISNCTASIPERSSSALFDVVHRVEIPAVGFQRILYTLDSSSQLKTMSAGRSKFSRIHSISNSRLRLEFHPESRVLHRVVDLVTGRTTSVSIDMRFYTGFVGDCASPERTPSGAYIFRPNEREPVEFPEPKVTTVDGLVVQEVSMEFASWATLVMRLYHNETDPIFEVEWTAGPIPLERIKGKELVLYYSTSLNTSSGTLYTDSNGRQMMKRRVDYRPSWEFQNTEPVAGNYYPVSNLFYLEDDVADQQFTLIVDRSQSMSSLHSGSVEAMLHRRLGVDDCLGVNEALNETGKDGKGLIARGRHWVLLGDKASSKQIMRRKNLELQMRPTVLARPFHADSKTMPSSFSALNAPLPPNIHLLTLEAFRDGISYLLRLEHIHDSQSSTQTVNLQTLFRGKQLLEMEEYSLSGAMPKKNLTRLQWNVGSSSGTSSRQHRKQTERNFTVTLEPTQIRTWRIRLL